MKLNNFYQKKLAEAMAWEEKSYDIKKRLEEVSEKIRERREKRERIEAFLREIETLTPGVTEFTDDLWLNLLDHMTVYSEDDIRFTFKDGTEIKV